MDPALFLKHNRNSILFVEHFIQGVASSTNWNDQKLDMVIDIGCGPGNVSTYWIDHYFPDIKRLIGFDVDPGMIALAKEHNKKTKIEYYVADIMEKDSLKEWEGKANLVFSHLTLHRVKDQKQAFRNMFDLMGLSSGAAVSFIIESPFYPAYRDLLKTPKWSQILDSSNFTFPEGSTKKYDAAHYKKMFEDVGFRVLECESKLLVFPFQTDEECKNLLMSLHYIGEVSDEVSEEYKTDLFLQYMKHSYRDKEGNPVHDLILLQAKLYKDCI